MHKRYDEIGCTLLELSRWRVQLREQQRRVMFDRRVVGLWPWFLKKYGKTFLLPGIYITVLEYSFFGFKAMLG